jgi:hypothetical protein
MIRKESLELILNRKMWTKAWFWLTLPKSNPGWLTANRDRDSRFSGIRVGDWLESREPWLPAVNTPNTNANANIPLISKRFLGR